MMLNSKNLKSFSLLVLLGAASGCDTTGSLPKPAKGYYGKETLGELPSATDATKNADVISLVQASGDMPTYRVKLDTTVRSGDTMACALKAGEIVDAIAERGTTFLIQAQRTSLARPCDNSGDADFVEGYVAQSDLEQVSQATSDAQQIGSMQPQTVTTITPTPSPQNLECESVKYGSYIKKNDAKSSFGKMVAYSKVISGKPNMIPGALWRAGGDEFLLRVKGKAEKWKVQAFNKSKKKKMDEKIISAASVKSEKDGEFEIPFKKFVDDPNNWVGASIEVVITPQSSDGADGKKTCIQKINLLSPLVLDFSGKESIETHSLANSDTHFDLNADGVAEQVGWVNGKNAAFLTLDLNNNGQVDNGSELFGEATVRKNKQRVAKDGFDALAQHDSNEDGRIDAADPVFKKLSLWFDRNQNGKSEKGEIISISRRKITWISLAYKHESRDRALQHSESLIPNDVRLSARFAASGCPNGVCKIYDIFFGSMTTQVLSKK